MQRYLAYLQPGKVDLLNDSLVGFTPAGGTYVLDDKPVEKKYDFIIASAHDPVAYMLKSKGNLILVVSYIPHMESEGWPAFYVNVCMADVLVMDSHSKQAIASITLPEKRIILADGCVPVKLKTSVLEVDEIPKQIPLINLDVDNVAIWNRFSEYVITEKPKKFCIGKSMSKHAVGVSFNGIGNVLASAMCHKLRHVTVAYNEFTSVYLDARCNNRVKQTIGNLLAVQGAAGIQKIREEFKTFVDDLETLVDHTAKTPVFKFESNANLFDRIFFEINRSNVKTF